MNILFRLNKILELNLSWRLLNIIYLVVIFIINIVSFYYIGATDLYNFNTLISTSIICILLILTMVMAFGGAFIIGSILSVLSCIYIFPRILSLQFFPRKIPFPFSVEISVSQINMAYRYLALGSIAIVAGAYLVDIVIKYFGKNKKRGDYFTSVATNYNSSAIIVTFMIFFIVQYLVSNIAGFNVFSTNPEIRDSKVLGIISSLFIPGVAAYLSFFMLFKLSLKTQIINKYIALLIFIYILYAVLGGSRSGPLQVMIMIISVMIALYENFKLKITKYFQFIAIILISSIISFHIGTILRHDLLIEGNRDFAVAVKHSNSKEALAIKGENLIQIDFSKSQLEVLRRLYSQFDIAILGIIIERDLDMSGRIINLKYLIKSGINILVPGVIFKDADLNSSLAWPFIYKFRDKILLENKYYYETFPWSIWTISYVMYGWLLGLAGLFFIGILIGAFYNLAKKFDEQGFMLAIFTYSLFPLFYTNGIDDYIVSVGRFIISSICFLLFYKYIALLFINKIKLIFKN